jgi:drug/metabolite transporter (DMT)-like permease
MATPDPDLRRARVRRAIPAVVLAVAGAVVAIAAGGSTAANAVAIMLLGIACVWAVSLVFYEIGLGEDRDRAAGKPGGPYDRP